MTRGLTAGFIAEAIASTNRPVLFYEGVFITQTLRIWSGVGDIVWNSVTWLGNGYLGLFAGGNEIQETQATGIEITLSGVPQAILSLILQEINQGASGKLYFGFLNSAGAVIVDPYPLFSGKADSANISEGPTSATVTLAYETPLIDLERPKEFRYTKESQRVFFPTDQGFDYVSVLQDWSGFWGQQKNKPRKKKGAK